jgi:hypothetical protein
MSKYREEHPKGREIRPSGRQWRLEIRAADKFHLQIPVAGFWSSDSVVVTAA